MKSDIFTILDERYGSKAQSLTNGQFAQLVNEFGLVSALAILDIVLLNK